MWEPLDYRGATKLLLRCFTRAGYVKFEEFGKADGNIGRRISYQKKKCNPHWFRHSRASLLAPHLPEALLCKYMGWKIGSKQVQTYLHLCPQQLEDAFLKLHGLKEEDEQKGKPQKCGCGIVSDRFARYCLNCGNP